jgi:hypothetical protein
MILCPICTAKTCVLETYATAKRARHRRGRSALGFEEEITTVEVVIAGKHISALGAGNVVVSSRQIAKLRELNDQIAAGAL